MNTFSKRLKSLRVELDLTQKELAGKINSSPSKIGMWEAGKRDPNTEDLILLCNIFDVSTDYILGKSEIKNLKNPLGKSIKSSFGSIFKSLREEKELTQQELVDLFNKKYHYKFGKSAVSQYENNKRIPEVEVLQKWAEFFDVGIDYLLGNSDAKPTTKEVSQDLSTWLLSVDEYKDLPKEDRDMIVNFAKLLAKRYKGIKD